MIIISLKTGLLRSRAYAHDEVKSKSLRNLTVRHSNHLPQNDSCRDHFFLLKPSTHAKCYVFEIKM